MSRWFVLLAFTFACKGKDTVSDPSVSEGDADTDTDTDADTDTDTEPCSAAISALVPAEGAVDVALSPDIIASFSDHVAEGEFTIGIDGVTGFTVLADDGLSATFTPDTDLAVSTAYEASASACGGPLTTSSFTTVGPGVDPTDLTGNTYGTVFGNLAFTEPPQAAINLAQTFGLDLSFFVLVGVQTYDAVNNELTAAATTGTKMGASVDPYCPNAIGDIVADFSANPTVSVGPETLGIPYNGDVMTCENFTMTGTFAIDGSALNTARITGDLDVRATGYDCGTFAFAGATCVACADGEPQCMVIDASAVSMPVIPGLDLVTECNL